MGYFIPKFTYLLVQLQRSISGNETKVIEAIPGVKIKPKGIIVPHHAVQTFTDTLNYLGIGVESAEIINPKEDAKSFDEWKEYLLSEGEVQEWVMDGFLTPFQTDVLEKTGHWRSTHLWHPTGCLSGDTIIPINRAGKSFKLRLDELVNKFHGKGRWKEDIQTRVQCNMDGYIRLNTLVDAVETGEKEVFEIITISGSIKATADHRFLTEQGFVPVMDLKVGDKVAIRGKKKSNNPRKAKSRYKLINLRNHPFAQITKSKRSDEWCKKRRFKIGYVESVYRVPEHRLIVEASENGLSYDEFISRIKNGDLEGLKFLDPSTIAVHHIDGNHKNNSLSNLVAMSHEEHSRIHGKEEHWKHCATTIEYEAIISIESQGIEATYDLAMLSPYNNYVANNFIVHNSGKTLSAILWSLSRKGSILVLTRAASRIQYGREFERFTKLRSYVIRPANERKKKGTKSLEEYIEWCGNVGQRPVVILGWESLTSVFDQIQAYCPEILIYDEAHKGKNTKRYEAIPLPDYHGEDFEERIALYKQQEREAKRRGGFIPDPNDPKAQKNAQFDPNQRVMIVPTMNITSCCSKMSERASYICCTTATPIKDRVRDLWGQLDLAEPKSWGTFNNWAFRYCDAKPGRYGGLDTTGESNLNELAERLGRVTHKIDYRDTHRHLPAKRRQSVYIAPADQCRPTAGFAKQLKMAAKRGGTALLEVRMAQAASSKRRAILDMVSDHLASGHKVTIFSGRRKDVEDIGDRIKKLDIVKKSRGKINVWAAHGGNDATERQAIVDQYMASVDACCLVGTGDSFGESLNMQDTDAAFFVMLPYTPGQLRQWEGRFCRLGQKRPVTIYYVIAEATVDEHIADILISKLPAVQKIAQDVELGEAKEILAGMDDPEEIAESILSKL